MTPLLCSCVYKYIYMYVFVYIYIHTHLHEHVFYIALKKAKCGNCKRLTEFCSSLKIGPL